MSTRALCLLLCILLLPFAANATQSGTTTTLQVPAASVAAGSAASLSATVTDANGAAVTSGVVTFLDGKTLLGSAQIVTTGSAFVHGTANLLRELGAGSHSVTAAFSATAAEAASTSAPQSVVVTNSLPTTATVASVAGADAGKYTLTGTLAATGSPAPTGGFNFIDQTDGNAVLGMAALGTVQTAYSFTTPSAPLVQEANGQDDYVIADLNNDGFLDVALHDSLATSSITTVFLGDGKGGLAKVSAVPIGISDTSSSLEPNDAVGDFNNDGIPDIASLTGDGNLYVFLGDGTGAFSAAPGSPFALPSTYSAENLAVADFNQDGNLDIFELGNLCTPTPVGQPAPVSNLLLGNGSGGFALGPPLSTPVVANDCDGVGFMELAVADLNQDGVPDLVSVDFNNVYAWINDGNGNFSVTATAGADAGTLVVNDFNGDGYPDVASVRDDLAIFLNDGKGHLGAARYPFDGSFLFDLFGEFDLGSGDFNGDGMADLLLESNSGSFAVLMGDGTGTFTQAPGRLGTFAPSNGIPYASAIEVADFNGDGLPDFGVISVKDDTTGGFYILMEQAAQTASAASSLLTIEGAGAHTIAAVYSGDGVYAASTSPTTSLTGVTVVPPPVPGYAISVSPTSATIAQGSSGTFVFTITPQGGFNEAIAFSCAGLPAEASCNFSPATLTPAAGPVTSTLALKTTAPTIARNDAPRLRGSHRFGEEVAGLGLASLALLLLPRRLRRVFPWPALVLALGLSVQLLSGCGEVKKLMNENADPGTPKGASTVTVTASVGSSIPTFSHSASLSIVIN